MHKQQSRRFRLQSHLLLNYDESLKTFQVATTSFTGIRIQAKPLSKLLKRLSLFSVKTVQDNFTPRVGGILLRYSNDNNNATIKYYTMRVAKSLNNMLTKRVC